MKTVKITPITVETSDATEDSVEAAGGQFVRNLLNPSVEKTSIYARVSALHSQADVNRQYASMAARTFAETGRESCLFAEAAHLAAASAKEREATELIDQAINSKKKLSQ